MPQRIRRSRTAIRRLELSRPVKLVLQEQLLSEGRSFFDYGCGLGDDCERLAERGFIVGGWDPHHRPSSERRPSDVVNLGYVVNVIEDPDERAEALKAAWSLARSVLVVAARMTFERGEFVREDDHGDGCVTSWQTFQKFYGQNELREWIDLTLGAQAVAAAPGVMLVFREESDRHEFVARRYRSRGTGPRLRQCDVLFEQNRDLVTWLCDFFEDRGRLPVANECLKHDEIKDAFGSIGRAFQVIKRVTGSEAWSDIAERRRDDLRVHFALERFGRRPRMGELGDALQRDVKALFGSYKRACQEADGLLFSAGDLDQVSRAMDRSAVGKSTQGALYVHVSAVSLLPPVLRVYEGCARRYYGMVEDANVVKLNRLRPKVSYLEYPDFDCVAHPTLFGAHVISLGSYDVRYHDNRSSSNPPILHRKETLVSADHPGRDRFEKLTQQEERLGLLSDSARIGRRAGWNAVLEEHKVVVRGHRVCRQKQVNP